VPLETADILTNLQTGLINAVPCPPIFAARLQFQTYASHMLNLNWAILVGGLVIKQEVWDRIPSQTQAVLLEAARQAGHEIQVNGRKEGEEAVAALQKRGLTVDAVTPEIEAQWRNEMERIYPRIRGPIVPVDIYDEVQHLLKAYRSGGGKP